MKLPACRLLSPPSLSSIPRSFIPHHRAAQSLVQTLAPYYYSFTLYPSRAPILPQSPAPATLKTFCTMPMKGFKHSHKSPTGDSIALKLEETPLEAETRK